MQSGWAKFRRQEGFMGRMVFSCFSAAWGCLVVCFFPVFDIGLCPKGDQDAQRSSFLFIGNPLHFPSASPWASEGKNIPLAKCLAARLLFFSVFCTAGSFQVIAALVNLPVLIYRCPLGFCLLFLVSYFCGQKRNARSWNQFSLSPYRHI